MMFYVTDFQKRSNKIIPDTTSFSVIISNNVAKRNEKILQHSIVVAAKPLIYFASVFGSKFSYSKKKVAILLLNKFYSLIIVIIYLISMTVIKPRSWHDTKTDVPLNILTQTYGIINIAEAVYSQVSVAIFNTDNFDKLFKKIDDIDTHFDISKKVFRRRRLISVLLILVPVAQTACTCWLRKFHIQNIGVHMTFFLIMLHGSILFFVISIIYIKLLMLNVLLMKRVQKTISIPKEIVFHDTFCDSIVKAICIEPILVQENIYGHCWFELMKMYDEVADCIHIFNDIYCGQVFTMYNTWLLCTLLIICRSLSPSLKYSEVLISDLFVYSCINSRPLFLATMCEMFVKERKKTVALLLHILLAPGINDAYVSQVRTMIMLVVSRKLEISANVFTVNIPTVMHFAGRIISYTVLMIQYFYSHVLLK